MYGLCSLRTRELRTLACKRNSADLIGERRQFGCCTTYDIGYDGSFRHHELRGTFTRNQARINP